MERLDFGLKQDLAHFKRLKRQHGLDILGLSDEIRVEMLELDQRLANELPNWHSQFEYLWGSE